MNTPVEWKEAPHVRLSCRSIFAIALCLGSLACGSCRSSGPKTDPPDPIESTADPGRIRAPGPPSGRRYLAAREAVLRDDTSSANRELTLALQENPLDADSHFLLGCLLERKGEKDQAIVAFRRTLELDPANPEALYNLGTMLLWRGEALNASRLLEAAVSTRPSHVPSYNNLAKAYFLVGLPDLAAATYEEALRRDPSNAVALTNLVRLTEAGGTPDGAAAYRRRLEELRREPAAGSAPDASGPAEPDRSPPGDSAKAATEPPVVTPPPAMPIAVGDDPEAEALRELLHDLPNVSVERRGGRLTLVGWTNGTKEREILDRVLGKEPKVTGKDAIVRDGGLPDILDLTSDDTGDANRLLEIDVVIFSMRGLDSQSLGFNFLRAVHLNFNYFALDNARDGTGYAAPPAVTGAVSALSQQGWIFGASVDYLVNIANASDERVAVLARPHLTTLSGAPAKFLAGGELVFEVSGINSGDIKPYPFGTTVTVTPTLLKSPTEDGAPRVHLGVEAGRTSVLSLLEERTDQPVVFEKISVTSEAVLGLGETLILSGLSQRESRTEKSGVPILRDIPLIRFLFSTRTEIKSDAAVIILLTPRDAAFFDQRNRKALEEFVEMRSALVKAKQGTQEDMEAFRARYPAAEKIAPNRFASHFFLMANSEIYRLVSGQDLAGEDVELNLLGPGPDRLRAP